MDELIDIRMHDGSRQFAALSESVPATAVRDYVSRLAGATLTGFLTDRVTEAWIDFEFHGHSFSINSQCAEYWFFVSDPGCCPDVLLKVVRHFRRILSRPP
jgi:hypothetical protein